MARSPRTKAPSKTPASLEIGGTGLRQYSGYIDEEFHKDLRGREAIKQYKIMSNNSATVGAILFAVSAMIRQVDWYWKPAKVAGGDEGAAFAEDVFTSMEHSLEDWFDEALSFLVYGWALFETVYSRRDDGRIGIRKFGLRAQDSLNRWVYAPDDVTLIGMEQQLPTGQIVTVPMDKCVNFRTTKWKDNPEGRSILRSAYRAWYFATKIETIEAIGIERELCGMPIIEIPAELMDNETEYAKWKKIIVNLRRDTQEGVIIPSTRDPKTGEALYKLSLLSTQGRRQIDTVAVKDGYKRDIAMTILADFVFLGQKAVGSYALADSKTEMFSLGVAGWLKLIASAINETVIPRLWAFNGMPKETQPSLDHGDIESPNLEQLGKFLESLMTIGVPVGRDDAQAKHLLGLAGLPIPEGEVEFDDALPPPGEDTGGGGDDTGSGDDE